MKGVATFLLVLCAHFLFAQDGGYFLTHYASSDPDINNVNFDIAQNNQGLICIANRAGVIQFDGKNWERISTPGAIFSLAINENNTIYTGGINGLGKVSTSRDHFQEYIQLSDSGVNDIFDITLIRNKLYAINQKHIYIYNTESGKTEVITPGYAGDLIKLVTINGAPHVITSISGLKLISGQQLKPPSVKALEDKRVEYISPGGEEGHYIIGFSNYDVAILKNGNLSYIPFETDYLKNSLAIDARWINKSLIAIATLRGGVLFANPANGNVEQIVNYQNGLPDNEVLAIALDRHKGLWVAHSKGFTRISPEFPFRAYNRYPGLQGDMLAALNFDNKLFVGTTLGLFYLDKVKEYNEKVVVEKQTFATETQPRQHERKGLFSFLKRNDKNDKDTIQYETRYVKNIKKELQSVRYVYKKVDSIESKVFHLATWNNRLFCGGLDGLFEIKDTTAVSITHSPVRAFYLSEHYNKIFINTYDDKFEVYNISSQNKNYVPVSIMQDFTDWVSYIFEDEKGRVWFCSNNDLYWIKLSKDEITDSDEYNIDNDYFYQTYGVSSKDTVYFVNESGIYYLHEKNNKLIKSNNNRLEKYIKDNNSKIWILNDEKWQTLGIDLSSEQLNVLSVFTDISHIAYDQQKRTFAVLTNSGNLYKLKADENINKKLVGYDPFLKNIKVANKIILPEPNLKFEQQDNSLTFEFVQPEYSGVLNIEYQYKIKGLNDSWSEWSASYNVIPIPYLPDGEYKLLMRSKNVVTGIKSIEPIAFQIVPPYWKRPWFLAAEFMGLGLILFIAFRLQKVGYKYQTLSRLVALLTLIIIIEFIQTVAENSFGSASSPVIDFLIQVIVAIVILPVEGLLRKYVFKEKEVQILDFISLKQKEK